MESNMHVSQSFFLTGYSESLLPCQVDAKLTRLGFHSANNA